jgi:uncharacterized protein (TIGR03663 family)
MAARMKQVSARARRRKSNIGHAEVPARQDRVRSSRDFWWWSSLAVLSVAALLRLLYLTQKPLHHDEGVNGLFLANLFRTGYYHYDPSNYHGPSLYYIAVVPTAINNLFHWGHGLSTFAIRYVTAAFGVGIVWLMLCLRRFLGTAAALAAAAFSTVSAGFVFFSRYFIHEILFVFFSLGVVVAWLWYRNTGKPRYLMLASASAAMLFATKETWIITAAVWLIAIPCTTIYLRLRKPVWLREQAAGKDPGGNTKLYLKATALFVAIAVLFYSSFFTNPRGILDSLLTFTFWTKTGQTSIYNRDWSTYIDWLGREEWPILVLGALGVVVAFIRARSYFTVFCAFWSLGIFAAYSLVPYKTPWLALSIILPLIIMAGYAIGEAYQPGLRAFTSMIAGAAILTSLYLAIDASFVNYDNDSQSYPYVYAHTKRDFLELVSEIDAIADANPAKKEIGITVVSPEHWPLPWYLREYTHVGYWGHVVPTSEPIVIALKSQVPQVAQQLGGNYRVFSTHELRPGNILVMFVRNDVTQVIKPPAAWQMTFQTSPRP